MAGDRLTPTPTTPLPLGVFLYPICTDRVGYGLMLSALDNLYHDDRDVTFLADFLNAQGNVDHPEQAPCFAGALNITTEQNGCLLRVLANGTPITDWIDICETIPGFTTDCPVTCGSGADSEESDDVAVQKVSIDCETGELVVDYGGCNGECRYDLSCISAPQAPPAGYVPPGGGENHDQYSACGKAYAAVRTIMQMGESFFTHCDDITFFPFADIQTENEGVEIRKNPDGLILLAYALGLKLINFEWTDQADLEQQYLCSVLPAFTNTDDNDLAIDANWETFRSVFRGSGIGNYLWGSFFDYLLGGGATGTKGVIGRDQLGAISQANAGDVTRDCGCPETIDPEIPLGYDWVVDFDFAQTPAAWTISEGDHIDALGIWSDPAAPWGNYNFAAQALPSTADETTLIKYAKLYIESGTTEIDNNEVPLSILFAIPIVLIPRSAFGASMPGGAVTRLWASAEGQALTNAAALQINQAGFTNNVAANLYVKRLVIAGDGTAPYGVI